MTSRNLVKRTLEFDHPQRVPRHKWVLPWMFNPPRRARRNAKFRNFEELFKDSILLQDVWFFASLAFLAAYISCPIK